MCLHPLLVVKTGVNENGKAVLNFKRHIEDNYDDLVQKYGQDNVLFLDCGKCPECLAKRGRDWATRCMLEASTHKDNCFITLTYRDGCVPKYGVSKRDFQLFIKRLRFFHPNIRYFACGEYGANTYRPHYHAIIFGWRPDDCVPICKGRYGGSRFDSKELSEIWSYGLTEVGEVTYQSCGYVARYCLKKLKDDPVKLKYKLDNKLFDEFILSSRRPAIGKTYFDLHKDKIYINDNIIGDFGPGKVAKPPKYFDKQLSITNPVLLELKKADRKYLSMLTEAASYNVNKCNRKEEIYIGKRKMVNDALNKLVRK